MRVLVLNSGSSSVKFGVYEADREIVRSELTGWVAGIGGMATRVVKPAGAPADAPRPTQERAVADHADAFRWIFESLTDAKIEAAGHRIVHGGDRFRTSVRLDVGVQAEVAALQDLAPLHNPPGLAGIEAARRLLGAEVPMVAVFDTAFHRTMPRAASNYALPRELVQRYHIVRYGFHGIAHASLAAGYASGAARALETVRLITLQLGNGCSAAAIQGGRSVDTSMGFTPLEGLVMGTRAGDLDPALVGYLARQEKASLEAVECWLNEQSGLLGVSGISHDVRKVLEAAAGGSEDAQLAVDLFCYRVRKYVGAYLAVLGGADAVIFGGGIGENSPPIRERICAGMDWCGLVLDFRRNAAAVNVQPGQAIRISSDETALPAYVVGADEERWIARETVRVLTEP